MFHFSYQYVSSWLSTFGFPNRFVLHAFGKKKKNLCHLSPKLKTKKNWPPCAQFCFTGTHSLFFNSMISQNRIFARQKVISTFLDVRHYLNNHYPLLSLPNFHWCHCYIKLQKWLLTSTICVNCKQYPIKEIHKEPQNVIVIDHSASSIDEYFLSMDYLPYPLIYSDNPFAGFNCGNTSFLHPTKVMFQFFWNFLTQQYRLGQTYQD